MSKSEKLLGRFKSQPSDFKWDELVRMLKGLGYKEYEGSGSRKCFRAEGLPQIRLHKPHPNNVMPQYAMKQVLQVLEEANIL